jgi:hypothetical protein
VFCANCSAALGGGNFCAACGAARGAPSNPPDWADEVRYDVIAAIPTIRDRIAQNFSIATQSANTQKVIEHMSRLNRGSGRAGIGLVTLRQSSLARKGVKVSGERAEVVQRPVGWVLADVLCRLAGCGHSVRRVRQGTDGCTLECVIAPSSRLFIGGELVVVVERTGQGTEVRALANLPGHKRDWGSSRQVLDQFFDNLL